MITAKIKNLLDVRVKIPYVSNTGLRINVSSCIYPYWEYYFETKDPINSSKDLKWRMILNLN